MPETTAAGWPREFDDDSGHTLAIGPSGGEGRCYLRVERKDRRADGWLPSALFGSMEIDDITRAMHEACGQEPPVMLGRPPVDLGRPTRVGRLQVWREPSGVVGFMPADAGAAALTGALRLGPSEVRRLAAVAVAYADAGPDPDETEVEELAKVMRLAIHPGSERLGLGPTEGDRTAALAALKWMRDREARDDRS